ncbi:MAG TPA: CHAD domain-containing protein [Trebonia sp.]
MTVHTRDTSVPTPTTAPAGHEAPSGTVRPPAAGSRGRLTKHSTAGEVLLAYLDAQAARLSVLDVAVRRDKPDAVHQMRVTVRRLRAALQSFTEILPGEDTEQLRGELKWLGGVLGAARDTEVLAGQLHAALAALPLELVIGPAQARVTTHFASREATTRQEVLDALDSQRYRDLRAALARLLSAPPLTPAAAEPAARVLPVAVARACRRTSRRMRRARRAPAGGARDMALHEARKAAKRARYAAEAAAPGLGKQRQGKARRLAKRMKGVQSVLGAHQDAVITRAEARDIGVHAHLAGENAFSFGLLHERAHHQVLATEDRARRAWRRARKSRL